MLYTRWTLQRTEVLLEIKALKSCLLHLTHWTGIREGTLSQLECFLQGCLSSAPLSLPSPSQGSFRDPPTGHIVDLSEPPYPPHLYLSAFVFQSLSACTGPHWTFSVVGHREGIFAIFVHFKLCINYTIQKDLKWQEPSFYLFDLYNLQFDPNIPKFKM